MYGLTFALHSNVRWVDGYFAVLVLWTLFCGVAHAATWGPRAGGDRVMRV